jgi:aarF domain-containing kinase
MWNESAGNMMRTTDGKLAILDFGLMTEVTDDQKYGMIEAIAHLLNRDRWTNRSLRS